MEPQRFLLVFHLAGEAAAIPLQDVERIAPMAELSRPPGLPSPLEGILNLAGKAVPVLRLGRLLQIPVVRPGLYSMLIVLKGGQMALLVDRVSRVLAVPESALVPVGNGESFNACTEATVSFEGEVIHLLSPARILLEKERQSISQFQGMQADRLLHWETGAA
jgi:purine-binding chemotaxis protein CheW